MHPLRRQAGVFGEAGWSGLKTTGLERGLVDEEWSRDLKGATGYKLIREMVDNSAIVGAILEYLNGLVIKSSTPKVEPRGEHISKSASLECADFLESCFNDMSITWGQVIADALSAWPYGWASLEVILKRRLGAEPGEDPLTGEPLATSRYRDGRIGWRKIVLRGQDTLYEWEFDPNESGDFTGWWQLGPFGGKAEFIPLAKTWHVRFAMPKNNPEGRQGLRNAVRSYYYSKRETEMEAIAIMRDAGGTVVGYAPKEYFTATGNAAMSAARTELERIVTHVGLSELRGILWPNETDARSDRSTGFGKLETLQGGGQLQHIRTAIEGHDKMLAISALMQWVFMAINGTGAYAAQANSSDISRDISVGSKVGHLFEQVRRYLVRPLMRLNTWPEEFWPHVTHGEVDPLNPEQLREYVVGMIGSGALRPSNSLERYVQKRGQLPEDVEDYRARAVPAPDAPGAEAGGGGAGG